MDKSEVKIGYCGFAGFGAYCDDIIYYAIKQTFDKLVDAKWINLSKDITPAKHCDLVIVGGGSLIGAGTHKPLLNLFSFFNKPGKLVVFGTGMRMRETILSKKISKINVPMNETEKRFLVKLFKKAKVKFVRGKLSEEKLKELKIEVEGVGDPVFLLEPVKISKVNELACVIRNIPKTDIDTNTDLGAVHKWIADFLKKNKMKCSFLSWVGWKNYHDNDYYIGRAISDLYFNSEIPVFRFNDCVSAMNHLATHKYLVSMRLHAYLLGLINGLKAFGIQMQFRKFEDAVSVFGRQYDKFGVIVPDLYGDIPEFDFSKLVKPNIDNVRRELIKRAEEVVALL